MLQVAPIGLQGIFRRPALALIISRNRSTCRCAVEIFAMLSLPEFFMG
jgi:hypothetical protein